MRALKDIREGLAANLSAIKGWQVSAYMLANPTPPTIWVIPGEVTYHRAMGRGNNTLLMLAQAFVPVSSDIGSQQRLDTLWESDAVEAAIESDRTLGGKVDHAHVVEATGYRTAVVEGRGPVLLCEWTVQIMASN